MIRGHGKQFVDWHANNQTNKRNVVNDMCTDLSLPYRCVLDLISINYDRITERAESVIPIYTTEAHIISAEDNVLVYDKNAQDPEDLVKSYGYYNGLGCTNCYYHMEASLEFDIHLERNALTKEPELQYLRLVVGGRAKMNLEFELKIVGGVGLFSHWFSTPALEHIPFGFVLQFSVFGAWIYIAPNSGSVALGTTVDVTGLFIINYGSFLEGSCRRGVEYRRGYQQEWRTISNTEMGAGVHPTKVQLPQQFWGTVRVALSFSFVFVSYSGLLTDDCWFKTELEYGIEVGVEIQRLSFTVLGKKIVLRGSRLLGLPMRQRFVELEATPPFCEGVPWCQGDCLLARESDLDDWPAFQLGLDGAKFAVGRASATDYFAGGISLGLNEQPAAVATVGGPTSIGEARAAAANECVQCFEIPNSIFCANQVLAGWMAGSQPVWASAGVCMSADDRALCDADYDHTFVYSCKRVDRMHSGDYVRVMQSSAGVATDDDQQQQQQQPVVDLTDPNGPALHGGDDQFFSRVRADPVQLDIRWDPALFQQQLKGGLDQEDQNQDQGDDSRVWIRLLVNDDQLFTVAGLPSRPVANTGLYRWLFHGSLPRYQPCQLLVSPASLRPDAALAARSPLLTTAGTLGNADQITTGTSDGGGRDPGQPVGSGFVVPVRSAADFPECQPTQYRCLSRHSVDQFSAMQPRQLPATLPCVDAAGRFMDRCAVAAGVVPPTDMDPDLLTTCAQFAGPCTYQPLRFVAPSPDRTPSSSSYGLHYPPEQTPAVELVVSGGFRDQPVTVVLEQCGGGNQTDGDVFVATVDVALWTMDERVSFQWTPTPEQYGWLRFRAQNPKAVADVVGGPAYSAPFRVHDHQSLQQAYDPVELLVNGQPYDVVQQQYLGVVFLVDGSGQSQLIPVGGLTQTQQLRRTSRWRAPVRVGVTRLSAQLQTVSISFQDTVYRTLSVNVTVDVTTVAVAQDPESECTADGVCRTGTWIHCEPDPDDPANGGGPFLHNERVRCNANVVVASSSSSSLGSSASSGERPASPKLHSLYEDEWISLRAYCPEWAAQYQALRDQYPTDREWNQVRYYPRPAVDAAQAYAGNGLDDGDDDAPDALAGLFGSSRLQMLVVGLGSAACCLLLGGVVCFGLMYRRRRHQRMRRRLSGGSSSHRQLQPQPQPHQHQQQRRSRFGSDACHTAAAFHHHQPTSSSSSASASAPASASASSSLVQQARGRSSGSSSRHRSRRNSASNSRRHSYRSGATAFTTTTPPSNWLD